MRIAILSRNNLKVYPALRHLAVAFAEKGASVNLLSGKSHFDSELTTGDLTCGTIPKTEGLIARIPFLRSNYHGIFLQLQQLSPDWIIAQHEYILPALAYKSTSRGSKSKVAGYFSDYYRGLWHTEALKYFAHKLDLSIEVCDQRVLWRKRDWPKLRADCFVVRQAPHRRSDVEFNAHSGAVKVVFTGSNYVLGLDLVRLGRFLNRLCELGISIDWYLPGPVTVRSLAAALCTHPLFSVREPIEKYQLLNRLSDYDVGLHWAPMAESKRDPYYFQSAASNKIGEYIAAGLLVGHAGNPGLAYLPQEICATFDPTIPEQGAEQLAAALLDRTTVEKKRAAALRYHIEEMNFERQADQLIQEICAHERLE